MTWVERLEIIQALKGAKERDLRKRQDEHERHLRETGGLKVFYPDPNSEKIILDFREQLVKETTKFRDGA